MKLYHFPPSPNSRRVLATAYHLGFAPELITVQLPAGENMAPEFTALNPNNKIPVFVDDDGFVVWESTAIMRYLISKDPDNNLYADDPRTQAQIDQWLAWNIAHWSPACQVYVFENLVKGILDLGEPDPGELKKAEELFHRFAGILNAHLKGKQWLVNEQLSIADFAVASFLDLRDGAKMPYQDYHEIIRWFNSIEALEAWKKSAPANFT